MMLSPAQLPLSFPLAAVTLLAFFLIIKYFYRLFLSPLSKFPGPSFAACSKLFEAYHILIANDWLETLEALHLEHGPIVRIGPNELHFSDHKFCLQHHKRTDLRKCENYYGILSYLLGGFASPHSHAKRKSIIQPLFSGRILAEFSSSTLCDHIDSLCNRLAGNADSGQGLNATMLLWAYTTDIMLSYVLNINSDYLKTQDLAALHSKTRAFSAIDLATALRSMPPVKGLFDLVPSLRGFSPLAWIDNLIGHELKSVIHESSTKDTSPTIMSQLWRQLKDERIVIHELAQAVFIGNESLLSNLTVLLHHMIRNPECIQKLREELDGLDPGTFGHRVWQDPKVMQLKYLDAVCRESTRMSAPGWHRQPRQVAESIMYGDHVIPPMTSLSFTLKLLEHDPALYREPQVFKPERWLEDDSESSNIKKSSVTFGTGTRTCLGQFIARQTLRRTLAALVYNFDMSFSHGEADKVEGYKYLNTYPKKGHEGHLQINFIPRSRKGVQ